MKTRETIILLALLTLCAVVAALALRGGDQPAPPTPSPAAAPEAEAPPADEAPAAQMRSTEVARDAGLRTASADDAAPRPGAGPAPESGVIDGRVQLTAGVAGTFSGYSIHVRELSDGDGLEGNREPFQQTYARKAPADESPLYFAIEDVPFTRHGYEVAVFVPGCNGSSQIVACDPGNWNPQVSLSLSAGGPFALRLIDQRRNPLPDRDVQLRPSGWPPGRTSLRGTTNSFGTAIFDKALGGDYDVLLDGNVVEQIEITLPGVVHDQADVGVQSRVLTVPEGNELRIEVFNAGNLGLADADLLLTQVDTRQLFRRTGVTDYAGVCVFEEVPPGAYQLDVRFPRHQPRSLRVEIPETGEPEVQRVRMVPVR